jgi:hypothetical protein
MKYIYCVVIPLILQLITCYTLIEINTGNGSFVGLAVFLFAIPILPATTIFNAIRTKTKIETKLPVLFGQSMLVAFVAPVIFVALYAVLAIIESII